MAATSEAILQVLCSAGANISHMGLCPNKSNFLVSTNSGLGYRRKKGSGCTHIRSSRHKSYNLTSVFNSGSNVNDRFRSLSCNCSQVDSVTDKVSEKRDLFLKGELSTNGNGTFSSTLHIGGVNSLEEEAWELLRASMVYYCDHPVGTIAANDPSDSSILNYDQVFIRDFIPSGIAFLLKGEYDIVRNFILHTLQLQVIFYS